MLVMAKTKEDLIIAETERRMITGEMSSSQKRILEIMKSMQPQAFASYEEATHPWTQHYGELPVNPWRTLSKKSHGCSYSSEGHLPQDIVSSVGYAETRMTTNVFICQNCQERIERV